MQTRRMIFFSVPASPCTTSASKEETLATGWVWEMMAKMTLMPRDSSRRTELAEEDRLSPSGGPECSGATLSSAYSHVSIKGQCRLYENNTNLSTTLCAASNMSGSFHETEHVFAVC